MIIEGDTIIFRSDRGHFGKEAEGYKPNTVRWFNLEEEIEFLDHKDKIRKIRIKSGKSDDMYFERRLTDATNIGWVMNMRLWVFSWKHREEGKE